MAPRGKAATLSIVIVANNKDAAKGLADTGKQVDTLGSRVKGLAVGLGTAFAVTKVVQWGKAASEAYRTVGGEVLKLQRYTGLAAEDASGLRLAAAMSGVDIAKLSTALGLLSKKIESGTIEDLGFQFKDASGEILPMDQVLGQIMDRFAEMPNGPEKAALALQIFGRMGADLIPLLSRGSAGLEEMKQKAEELGVSFDEAGLEQVKEATKNQREFNQAMLGMKVAVGAELQPLINDVTALAKTALPPAISGLRTTIGLFTALPPAIQASAVAAGAGVLVLPRLASALGTVYTGVAGLTSLYPRLSSALQNNVANLSAATKATAGAAAGIGAFLLATEGLEAWSESQQINADINDLTIALEGLARTGEVRGELAAFGTDLEKLGEAFSKMNKDRGDAAQDLAKGLVPVVGPIWAGSDLAEADAALATIEEIDQALASIAARDPELALAVFNEVSSILQSQGVSVDDINAGFDDYGSALETAGIAAEGETDATEENTAAHNRQADALARATKAYDDKFAKFQRIRSAAEAVHDAEEAVAQTTADLAEAQRAAAGDSEEMRDALQAEADAAEAVADAERGVADAQEQVRERREALNEAWAEATKNIEDTARAARQAALDESQAVLDVRAAEIELQRVLSDSGSTALERDQARQDLAEAQAAQDQAAADAAQARLDALNAQNPANDERVIAAREALADAEDGVSEAKDRVTEANERVQEAERNTAQVAEESAKRYQDAQKAAQDAAQDLVDKQSELTISVYGTKAGVADLEQGLRDLANTFAPGTPERTHLEWLIQQLSLLENGGMLGIGSGANGSTPGVGIPQDESRDPVRPRARGAYSPTYHIYGSSLEERRLLEQHEDRQRRKIGLDASGG